MTRLGEGLEESGRLTEPAIERTADAMVSMVEEAQRAASSRSPRLVLPDFGSPQPATLADSVQDRCGVTVEVISGEDEGRPRTSPRPPRSPSAAARSSSSTPAVGALEFSFGHDEHVEERFSVNVGAVSSRNVSPSPGSSPPVCSTPRSTRSRRDLDRLDGRTRPNAVIAMGGTATNLAAVKHALAPYDPEVVHGTVLDIAEIDRQIELYRTHDTEGRRQIVGLQPQRARSSWRERASYARS